MLSFFRMAGIDGNGILFGVTVYSGKHRSFLKVDTNESNFLRDFGFSKDW